MNPGLIEKYQILFAEDPSTKSFAPLAEAYRRMGMLDEAKQVCETGLKHHPQFTSGLVAYAKILIDKEDYAGAIASLEKVIDSNSDNILAYQLLGACYLKEKNPTAALRAYKMLLFLAPNHAQAQKQVQKLESLSARGLSEDSARALHPSDLFEELDEDAAPSPSPAPGLPFLQRVLSLADALSVRGDIDKAVASLKTAREKMGDHPEIIARLQVLDKEPPELELNDPAPPPTAQKIQRLEKALHHLQQNRRDQNF